MRSLTELAGLEDSSLATISASHPSVTLDSLTRGVLPMRSRTLSAILGLSALRVVVVNGRMVDWEVGVKALVVCAHAATVNIRDVNFMLLCIAMQC